ncbi:MAG TPA: AAA family ATPase, partial [Plasticicumulans sp.]|nr:AAA family ATPase [Plasticicumulans sp.]
MYETSFGFTRSPFLDPEGSEFRPCGAQAAVLAELREALDAGAALVVLSGPIGTGKTTLLRRALGEPMRQRHVVLFWNAHVGPDDLLNYLCDDLDLRSPGTGRTERLKALRTALVRGLSEGWSLLIAVDDAQNLPAETLAELHALLDLREVGHGLVQVLLCGQPELQDRLVHDPQRDAHPPRRLTLRTLDATESAAFIAARLAAAGRPDADLFDAEALVRIHELAHGVPRLLNRICNQSLLLAYLGSERRVSAALVRDVAADTPPTEPPPQPAGPLYEAMPARPVIAADSVPHMHAPVHESVPAAVTGPGNAPAPVQAASAHLHADPHAHGHSHRSSRRRSRWWIGLAAVLSALALAGFAAWRNGWLPGLPPPRPAAPL